MLNRWIEQPYGRAKGADDVDHPADDKGETLVSVLADEGLGAIVFSPLAQGLLTSRYLDGVPAGARAKSSPSWRDSMLTDQNLARVRALNEVAKERGQTLAQMAVAWALRLPVVSSALVGASSVQQLEDTVGALKNLEFDQGTLDKIDHYAIDGDINIWSQSSFA